MPTHILEGAIIILAAVLADAILLGISSVKNQGSIKLQPSDDHIGEKKDPFDIVSFVDWEDGEAINEKLFWTKVSIALAVSSPVDPIKFY
jgi:hypothetical protein